MCSPQGSCSFSAIQFDDGVLTDLIEESEGKREGKRVTCTRASC